jgi:type II secretory pathway pseudopilin PulG
MLKVHGSIRDRCAPAGFTYIALLAAIVIIGISMSAAGKYWQNVMMREKEEELLFRGEQYRLAIERYFLAKAPNAYPQDIDQLVKDDRFPQAKRHLRQKYLDPMTGEEFEVFRDLTKGNRITGVFSKSKKEPLKKTGFPDQYKDFENKALYSDWKFLFSPPAAQPVQGVPAPPRPGPGQNAPGFLWPGQVVPGQSSSGGYRPPQPVPPGTSLPQK